MTLPEIPRSPRSGDIRVGASVSLKDLTKRFGDVIAVNAVTLDVAAGEFITLLGPSGCGKTTTIMLVAGFHVPSSGEVLIDERSVGSLPPNHRNVGVIFQNYALFPHMTVAENIAFPLRMRHVNEAEIRRRVESALELVRLPGYGPRFPSQLSGGQQQRVAFARAIVFEPQVLLMDEPLGALDRKLREHMQLEMKSLHDTLGVTIIYVTHDQIEALTMSNRVAVMNNGRIEQVGSPEELYDRPANGFVADFVGESNFMSARVQSVVDETCVVTTQGGLDCVATKTPGIEVGCRVNLFVRPERVVFAPSGVDVANYYEGRIDSIIYMGGVIKYLISLSPSETIAVIAQSGSHIRIPKKDEKVWISWRIEDVRAFAAREEGHT